MTKARWNELMDETSGAVLTQDELARDTLADRVANLERRSAIFDELCGQMIATMVVNMKSEASSTTRSSAR